MRYLLKVLSWFHKATLDYPNSESHCLLVRALLTYHRY